MQRELSELRVERDRLAAEVLDSYRKVDELQASKDAALSSVALLQQQLDEKRTEKVHLTLNSPKGPQPFLPFYT